MDSELLRAMKAHLKDVDAKVPAQELVVQGEREKLQQLKSEQTGFRMAVEFAEQEFKAAGTAAGAPASADSELRPSRKPRRSKKNGSYTAPGVDTNLGRALHIIRSKPEGITMTDLIAASATFGKPLVVSSIGSQLSQMIKRDIVKKVGDRYVAAQ